MPVASRGRAVEPITPIRCTVLSLVVAETIPRSPRPRVADERVDQRRVLDPFGALHARTKHRPRRRRTAGSPQRRCRGPDRRPAATAQGRASPRSASSRSGRRCRRDGSRPAGGFASTSSASAPSSADRQIGRGRHTDRTPDRHDRTAPAVPAARPRRRRVAECRGEPRPAPRRSSPRSGSRTARPEAGRPCAAPPVPWRARASRSAATAGKN